MAVYEIIGNKRKKNFWSLFGNLNLTYKLIIVNVVAFIVFWVLIGLKVIGLQDVALRPYNFLHGKYIWTLITSMFMHAGFFHIFFNMISLFFVGIVIERIIGRKRYLWFYLISGIFAGLFFIFSAYVFQLQMSSYAVGASGAIFGLLGLLIFLIPNQPVYIMFIPIPIKMKYAAPGMLILLWLISIAGNVPIGNMAHLGGLVSGVIYGIYLRRKFPNKIKYISRQFS